jgi:predicted AlkP superfamily pyrophosphatase or phosphodiesterase
MNQVSIFMLIDALGWDYIKDRPFLNDIAKTKRPVKSILGFSSGVIPSILTGKYPPEHKHWFLYFYSPKKNCFLWTKVIAWLPKKLLNNRYTRKIVEETSKRLMGYTGYFETYLIPIEHLHLYDICENKNIYAPGGMRAGRSLFDVLTERGVDYKCFSYPIKDKDIFSRAKEVLKSTDSNYYFLYFSESDAYLHRACKDPEGVRNMIDFYERQIREVYQAAAKKFDTVNLYIFSDHSMAPVNEEYDLKADVEALGYRMPKDYVSFYDSTMGRFWFFNEQARKDIEALLKTKNYGRILTKEEVRERHVDFTDNMYGELLFLMKTGAVINPSNMGCRAPQGMHGYDIDDGVMDGIMVSNTEYNGEVKDVKDFFEVMVSYIKE